ncbi:MULTISPECIES: DMT family transporter [Gluconobacter]|uniref:DMT family transporter n=1 Tax=Gluconobacter TaxID=441 RepID=UPI002ADDD6A7|nr:DMT family transporter [Gluconobacter cadivus]
MLDTETENRSKTSYNIPLGTLCGVGAGALWGLVFLAPELARDFTPLQLAIGRFLAYGIIAFFVIMPRWPVLKSRLKKQDWRALFWLSLFGNTLYYILLSKAVQSGGIALTSLVIGFLPVAVTIIGSRDKGAVSLTSLLPSLLLCGAGAVCIGWQALKAPEATHQTSMGLLWAITALLSWTAYAVGNSRSLVRLSTVSVHDWNLLIGLVTGAQAACLVPIALLSGHLDHDLMSWSCFVGVSTAVAIIASFLGNALWNKMSRLLPLTMTGQMILFETLFALIYGFLWEGRWPRPIEVAAFTLIVCSVMTCVSAHRKHHRTFSNAAMQSSRNGV